MYDPTNSELANNLLRKLKNGRLGNKSEGRLDLESLRIHSMRTNFCHHTLACFYEEHMIPHFPLEDERDSLEDWMFCLNPVEKVNHSKSEPLMDVLLLICNLQDTNEPVILAGIAFEYYKISQVGLVSYITTKEDYRRMGLMKALNQIAIFALKELHYNFMLEETNESPSHGMKAVIAETNTVDAGDASVQDIRNRHQTLFALGYRFVEFPYVQPPLGTDVPAFDDVMLLVYQGNDEENKAFAENTISSNILFNYVQEFALSVFGDDENGRKEVSQLHFYRMNQYFVEKHQRANILPDLPWNSVLEKYYKDFEQDCGRSICIIGAGCAGLSTALKLGETATKEPTTIHLIEANKMVGGRLRTIVTNQRFCDYQYVDKDLVARYEKFAPFSVSVGGEFIHGINSSLTEIIEECDINVDETFDLCSHGEYPFDSSFVRRPLTNSLRKAQREGIVKIYKGGKTWNLRQEQSGNYGMYISEAKRLWDKLCDILQDFENGTDEIPEDMSLSKFIDKECAMDTIGCQEVKSLINCIFANTAGSNIANYGVNEGCREETQWEYTESNFRTRHNFAEIIQYYIDGIEKINKDNRHGTKIKLHLETDIISIADTADDGIRLETSLGQDFVCDRVVVAVPLAILQKEYIHFSGMFSLPSHKRDAIHGINMYTGMKVHALLKHDVDIMNSGIIQETDLFFCPDTNFPQVWIERCEASTLVTGFIVEEARDEILKTSSEKSIKGEFLLHLKQMFKTVFIQETPTCSAFEVYDWSEDNYIGGLYSSPTVGAGYRLGDRKCTLRDYLREPLHDRVFFAGEHTQDICATVQSAIDSGLRAAEEVRMSMK